jgi:hypothetical protein
LISEGLERVRELASEVLALRLNPALEISGIAQVEAVEEGTVILIDGCRQVPVVERLRNPIRSRRNSG